MHDEIRQTALAFFVHIHPFIMGDLLRSSVKLNFDLSNESTAATPYHLA